MITDGDSLWIAGGGITRYDKHTRIVEVFHTEDGLISNGTTCLALDRSEKTLWIGTADGVSQFHYETGEWQSLTKENGLIDNWVQAVAISNFSNHKTVFLGTRHGLSTFAPAKSEWKNFTIGDGLRDNWITSLSVDDLHGLLWVGTARGLNRYNIKGQGWENSGDSTTPMWIVDLIAEKKSGNVWCATFSHGIKQYGLEQEKWHDVFNESESFFARCLGMDQTRNTLWLGTDDGLWSHQSNGEESQWSKHGTRDGLAPASVITSILVDEQRRVSYLATNKGIFQYDIHARQWSPLLLNDGLVHNDVNQLIFDQDGNLIWFATDGGGIASYDLAAKMWHAYSKEDGLFSNRLKTLAINMKDRSLWLGAMKGIGVFHRDTKRVHRIGEELSDATVSAIVMDEEKGSAWIGVWGGQGGLHQYDLKDSKIRVFNDTHGLAHNNVTSIALDGNLVWVGTGGGVSQYNSKTNQWRSFNIADGLSNNAVITLTPDRKHQLIWVATEFGINCYDKRQRHWRQFFKKENGLAHDTVLSIAVDEERGVVWFGTEGFGVTRFDRRRNEWKTFTSKDGLANNYIHSILIDRGRNCIWLGTLSGGVSRFCDRTEDRNRSMLSARGLF